MPRCVFRGCDSTSDGDENSDTYFHCFPDNPGICDAWMDNCGIEIVDPSSQVCSKHFRAEDYRKFGSFDNKKDLILMENAIPSIEM